MADNTAAIARLQAMLDTGATTAVIDGVTLTVDPKAIRKRIRELTLSDDAYDGTNPRPAFTAIDLTGF